MSPPYDAGEVRYTHGMRIAYLDCVGGISGDMLLAALIGAGADARAVQGQLDHLRIRELRLEVLDAEVGGFAVKRARIAAAPEQTHRRLADIHSLIDSAPLMERVKEQSKQVFERLAEAEASVHQMPSTEVHFHEVGAMDAIADIVGVCIAIDLLQVERLFCSALPMGRGVVECAHGIIPVPAPAVVELLRGKPTYGVPVEGETVTPTGAALAVMLCDEFGNQPPMIWETVGIGAGGRAQSHPNILRVFIGEAEAQTNPTANDVMVIEANLDDMSPEWAGYLLERLFGTGALDASFTPAVMKKNRPGFVLTVLCEPSDMDRLAELIFVESTTFGLRYSRMSRVVLDRRVEVVNTAYGPISIKLGEREGRVTTAAPEFEDCRTAAENHGVPIRRVYEEAAQAERLLRQNDKPGRAGRV